MMWYEDLSLRNEQEGEWQKSTTKIKIKYNKHNNRQALNKITCTCEHEHNDNNNDNDNNDNNAILEKIKILMGKIRNLQYNEIPSILREDEIDSIVCYGLGSFVSSSSSLMQLCYLLFLQEILTISSNHNEKKKKKNIVDETTIAKGKERVQMLLYDPTFTALDKKILVDSFGFTLIENNEEAKRKIADNKNKMTLFYMPHCSKQMYSNLLWANWNPSLLSRLVIIGNSFSNYDIIQPISYWSSNRCVHLRLCIEHKLATESCVFIESKCLKLLDKFEEAFNNFVWHVFLPISDSSSNIWQHQIEEKSSTSLSDVDDEYRLELIID